MAVWLGENKQDVRLKIVLFIVSPFVSFIYSLFRLKTKSSFVVFFLFTVFFGFSIIAHPNYTHGGDDPSSLDAASYRMMFDNNQINSFNDYFEYLKNYFTFKEGIRDIYLDTIIFGVTRFSNNYHMMWLIIAIVIAFFMLKSLRFLTQEDGFDTTLSSFLLLCLFFFESHFFTISYIRFWTALWIGIYCLFKMMVNGNTKYILPILLLPMIHNSMFIFVLLVIVSKIFKKHTNSFIVVFLISTIFLFIGIDFILSQLGTNVDATNILASQVSGYTNADYIDSQMKSKENFLSIFSKNLLLYYINLVLILFIANRKTIINNPKTYNLFRFLLILSTFINLTSGIPSLGSRFSIFAFPIIAYIWIVIFKPKNKYKLVLYAIPFVYSLRIIFYLRLYNFIIEPIFYVSNPMFLINRYLLSLVI